MGLTEDGHVSTPGEGAISKPSTEASGVTPAFWTAGFQDTGIEGARY